MLEVNGIDVFYGKVPALRNVSLSVGRGEMVALLGANGAGKTTTLRTISGLLAPRSGSVLVDGEDVAGRPAQEVIGLGVSQLPQGRELFSELTVMENLRLGHWSRRKDGHDEFTRRLENVLVLFPKLEERRHQAAGTMSGGEQQMLAMARALMCEPDVLLVDELSMGLAPLIVTQLFEALEEVNRRGTAVLVVEQFVTMALKHTHRAYVLAKGEIVAEDSSEAILASPGLVEAYLG
jgi:branched-chain amino acid transport system ATP-binding protein